jgi:uncharacterized protein YidB (DUF937 family)
MNILNALVGALGGGKKGANGMAEIASIAMQNPQLMQVAASMLAADNKHGGLAGLMGKLQGAGLGDVAQSWVSTGANKPVEPAQLTGALGADAMSKIAAKAGISAAEAPALLAQVLPALVDRMTPKGAPPTEAPASADALLGLLGALGKRG